MYGILSIMNIQIDRKRFHIDNKYFLEPIELEHMRLIQVGERFCGRNQGFPEHKQLCWEITLVYDGAALNGIDGAATLMKKPSFNLTFPPQRHCITAPDSGSLRYFYLGFELLPAHPLYTDYQALKSLPAEKLYAENPFRTHSTFLDALGAASADDKLSRFILATAVNQILIDCLLAIRGEKKILHEKFASNEALFSMLSYLDENFLSFKNLNELSVRLGYSVSHLSHLFSAAMLRSPTAYVLDKKMHYAAQLILENRMRVTEIAELMSYDSIHAFSKAFKKYFNVSPLRYREIAPQPPPGS